MFNQWGMRHGPAAFAWGGMRHGHGWSGWGDQEADADEGPGGHHGWHHRGHHGGRHGRGPQGGWPGGPGPGAQFGWQGGPGGQPWMRHGGPGFAPPLFWMVWALRRGFGGGPGRGPGRGPGGPRAFGRGDLKYQLLALLTERPKHGYEMIKELEDQAGGFYTPSAGAVYPSLQLMEDRGWITSQTQDGKKVYTITDTGREALQEHQQQAEEFGGPGGWGGPWGHRGGPFGHAARPELDALRNEGIEVARLLWMAVMHAGGDPAQLTRLREIITGTRHQLEEYLRAAGSGPAPEPKTQKLGQEPKPDEYL